MTIKDITPEGSPIPVYLDPTPIAPEGGTSPAKLLAEMEARRAIGIAKLVTLGLTEDEARAIAGLPPA